MAMDDAQRRAFLQKNVTSDLQMWEDSEVSLETQHKFAQHSKSLRVFIAMAESSTEMRDALKADFSALS